VVHGQHDLRHPRACHRFHEVRASPDDTLMLGVRTDHEPGNVLDEQQRDALSIAALDEECHLLGAFGVDDAAEARPLAGPSPDQPTRIGNDADREALDVRIAAEHLLRQVGLELVESSLVEHRTEQRLHIVRQPMIGGQDVVQSRGWLRRRAPSRGRPMARLGQAANQLAQLVEARRVVVERIVGHDKMKSGSKPCPAMA